MKVYGAAWLAGCVTSVRRAMDLAYETLISSTSNCRGIVSTRAQALNQSKSVIKNAERWNRPPPTAEHRTFNVELAGMTGGNPRAPYLFDGIEYTEKNGGHDEGGGSYA